MADMIRREPDRAGEAGEGATVDETFIDERGVTLSRAGVERAGRRLAESRARHTADYFVTLRARLNIPRRAA